MLSTPEQMLIDTQLLSVIESLQDALQVGENATDLDSPVNSDGDALKDFLGDSPAPSYAYAYGWTAASIKSAVFSLETIRTQLTNAT
jgi:hypothetical protein